MCNTSSERFEKEKAYRTDKAVSHCQSNKIADKKDNLAGN